MKKSILILTLLFAWIAAQPVRAAVLYALDDGTHENSLGLGGGGTFSWANRFTVVSGGGWISGVSVYWDSSYFSPGSMVTVVVLSDPNNDGDPSDAVTVATRSVLSGTGYVDYSLVSPVNVGSAGSNFFAGVIATHGSGQYPAALDQTSTSGRSWISLSADLTQAEPLSNFFSGNFMVRATSGSFGDIPEPSTLATTTAGLAVLLSLRRRRA